METAQGSEAGWKHSEITQNQFFHQLKLLFMSISEIIHVMSPSSLIRRCPTEIKPLYFMLQEMRGGDVSEIKWNISLPASTVSVSGGAPAHRLRRGGLPPLMTRAALSG